MGVARHVVNADNDEVRVTTWTFGAAGAATGQHRHEFDYVVVPITGGRFEVVDIDGSVREMNQVAGSPYLGQPVPLMTSSAPPPTRRSSSKSS